jgi:hypothetical protein
MYPSINPIKETVLSRSIEIYVGESLQESNQILVDSPQIGRIIRMCVYIIYRSLNLHQQYQIICALQQEQLEILNSDGDKNYL